MAPETIGELHQNEPYSEHDRPIRCIVPSVGWMAGV